MKKLLSGFKFIPPVRALRFTFYALRIAPLCLCAFAPLCLSLPLSAGTTAAQFLNLGFGAKAPGMADAFVSESRDITAGYYNPGAFALEAEKPEWTLSHSWHVQDTGLTQAAFRTGRHSFMVSYFSAGELEGRDASQNITGDFTAYDLAFSGGTGVKYAGILFGASVKGIQQKIKSSSGWAAALDAGAIYDFEETPLSVGVSMCNLGTRLKLGDEAYALPLVFRAGGSWHFQGANPATVSLEGEFPDTGTSFLKLGAEYSAMKTLSLRAGWKTTPSSQKDAILGRGLGSTADGVDKLYGFYMGFGVSLLGMQLDYSLLPYGELGSSHRFSVGAKF